MSQMTQIEAKCSRRKRIDECNRFAFHLRHLRHLRTALLLFFL
jgi:hypothetical protein